MNKSGLWYFHLPSHGIRFWKGPDFVRIKKHVHIACLRLVRKKYGYSRYILEFSKNTFFVSNFLSIEPCRFYNIIRRSAPIFCQRSASAQGDFSKSLSAHAKVFHQIYAFIGSKKTWQNFQSKTAGDEKYSTSSFTVFVQKSHILSLAGA